MAIPADVLVLGGRVFRGFGPAEPPPVGSEAGRRPPGAPTAVAIRGDRIMAVGGDPDIAASWRGPRTEVIDARGGLILAGFDDAHVHALSGAADLDRIDVFGIESLDAVLDAIRAGAAVRPDDPWVVGGGWLYAAFPGGLPTRGQLDSIVPDRPAYLSCYDGHTGWANSRALALAGIDGATPDPPNGRIVRDPTTDEPTGILKEAAVDLVEDILPRPAPAELEALVRRAVEGMQRAGITAIQDAWTEPSEWPTWRVLADGGGLGIRARLALPMRPHQTLAEWRDRLADYETYAFPSRGGDPLSGGILKVMADGVVESRTAAMLAPYVDDDSTGLAEWEPGLLDAFVREADARGWQVEIHAIGDRAVRMGLDSLERAATANGPWSGDPLGRGAAPGGHERRHRLEHVETIDPADIARFGRLGVIASMQPFHADPSPNQVAVWAANIGPERAGRAWAWRSILDAGGRLALGSDWPVVPFDPIRALNSAVNRQTMDGRPPGGWLPEQRLTLGQALSAYTVGSAYAAHEESRRGTLAPGLAADVVVLDRDLLEAGPSAIIGTTVALTVAGGRIVHREEGMS